MIRWLVVGVVVVLAGLVMVPLPGPGWLVPSVGIALLVVAGVAGFVRIAARRSRWTRLERV